MNCLSGRRRGTCIPECPYYGVCHCSEDCGAPTAISVYNQPSRGIHVGHYSMQASGHRRNKVPTGSMTSKGVPRERVAPLVRYLVAEHGSLSAAAIAIGVPRATLNNIVYGTRRKRVRPELAQRTVAAVLAIRARRHPDAPHAPRPPTPLEAKLADRERERIERKFYRDKARVNA